MSRIKRKPIRNKTEALKEQLLYEKKVSKTFERMSVRLKERVNELDAEAAGLREAVAQLQRYLDVRDEIISSQRDRIYKLMCSVNDDCRVAGIEPIAMTEPDDPGEDGWWPKDGLFEQEGAAQ